MQSLPSFLQEAEAVFPELSNEQDATAPLFRLERFARCLVKEIATAQGDRLEAGFACLDAAFDTEDLELQRGLYTHCLVHLHFTGIPIAQAQRATALMPPRLLNEWQDLHTTLDALEAHAQDAGKTTHGTKI